MIDDNQLPLRKIIIVGACLLVGVLFVMWFYRYLTTGTIAVSTNNSSDIVAVQPVNLPPGGTGTKSATHDITVHVKPGTYIVSVSSRSSATSSKVVTVQARHKVSFVLNPTKASPMEPVLPNGATSMAADASTLVYVDSATKNIMVVGNGQPQKISPLTIRQASLATPAVGVAQDESGNLYQVSSSGVAPLETGGHTSSLSLSNISISKTGLLAFTSGNTVYAGRLGSEYKAIGQAEKNTKVFAGNTRVAIVQESEGQAEGENKITVVNMSGGKVEKEVGALQMQWSPSDKYVFVAAEKGNFIYDNNLNLVRTLDSNGLGSATWVDDNDLAYSSGKYVWSYSLSGGQANQISRGPDDISLLSTSSDSTYVYVVTGSANHDGASAISRVGLKRQPVSNDVRTLGIFLPDNVGVCGISYVNFVRPTITVSYPASTTTPEFCINAAKGKLVYYDVNASKFQYSTTPNGR